MANGSSGHTCQCNEGSANLLNKTSLACLKQCKFLLIIFLLFFFFFLSH